MTGRNASRWPGKRSCKAWLLAQPYLTAGVLLVLYASTGVAHVWLIDPTLRTIEVYEASDGRPTLVATARDADVIRLPPFDTELSLAAWWKAPAVPAVTSP